MKKEVFFLCIFLFIAEFHISAQSYGFEQYTVNEGLASNETYYTHQATDGYLYISTDRGLQRFDGQKFVSVSFYKPELEGSTVFSLFEDDCNTLWVSTYREGLFYLYNDTLRPHRLNDRLKEILRNSFIDQFFFDKRAELYFSVHNLMGYLFHVHHNKIDTVRSERQMPFENYSSNQKQVYINGLMGMAKPGAYKTDSVQQIGNLYTFKVALYRNSVSDRFYPKGGPIIVTPEKILVAAFNNLLSYSHCGEFLGAQIFDTQILSILDEGNGNLLIGCINGFYSIHDGEPTEHLLKGYLINDITKDQEGGYWFATTTMGLFYLPSFDLKVLLSGHRIASLNAHKSKLVITDHEPHLHIFDIDNDKLTRDTSLSIKTAFRDVLLMESQLIFSGGVFQFAEGHLQFKKNPYMAARSYLSLEDTATLFAISSGAYVHNFNRPEEAAKPLIKDEYFFCNALAGTAKYFYLGTDKGLILYDRANRTHGRLLPDALGHFLVNDLKVLNDSILIVATKSDGIFVLKHHEIVAHFTAKNSELPSSSCNRLALQGDSTCWVGTDAGVYRLMLNGNRSSSMGIERTEGIYSQKINALAVSGSRLFIGTDRACYYLNTDEAISDMNTIPLKVNLPDEHIAKQTSDTIWLKPGVRSILIQSKPISFRYKNHLEYTYQLEGESPVYTLSSEFYINKLSPGLNTLLLNVANPNGRWNAAPVHIYMMVPSYYYEKIIYQVMGLILLLGMLAGLIYIYVHYRYEKKMRQWKFSTLRLRALNLQLNPHFIFNAINNIHHLALNGSREEIKGFISNFTRLTRKVLDNSNFKVISLAEEIENIVDFVALEKLRFKDHHFDFQLNISLELNVNNSFVPPMILQPCVENAIWHGLLPKDSNRILSLKIQKTLIGFCVEIEDNGIGLLAANTNQAYSERTTAVGVDNTKLRLDIYEEMKMGKCDFSLTECFDAHQKSIGTLAVFDFKPNYKEWNLL